MNTGERNYGCRYQEIFIYGYKSLILENEVLRTTIILDRGCEIVEFNYKKLDLDFVWKTQNGLGSLRNFSRDYGDDYILTDYYTGGWFEAFPVCGAGGEYYGTHMPIYGEVCYLPWDYIVLKNSEDEVIIKAYCKTIRSPFYLEKNIILKSMQPVLLIEDSILNVSSEALHFNIGYHPNFGSSFIDNELEFEIPAKEVEILWENNNSRFKIGQKGIWPDLKDREGNLIDLRVVPTKQSKVNEIISLKNLKNGFITVRNREKNIAIKVSFDEKIYKNAILWIVRNGDSGYPRYGNTNVVCVLPKSNHFLTIEDVSKYKDYIEIKSRETISTWIKYEIT
jgi:galactose mutarotase-like enzyme